MWFSQNTSLFFFYLVLKKEEKKNPPLPEMLSNQFNTQRIGLSVRKIRTSTFKIHKHDKVIIFKETPLLQHAVGDESAPAPVNASVTITVTIVSSHDGWSVPDD